MFVSIGCSVSIFELSIRKESLTIDPNLHAYYNIIIEKTLRVKLCWSSLKNADGGMSMPRIDENTWFLDERPMDILTKAERQERFDREIGPDIDTCWMSNLYCKNTIFAKAENFCGFNNSFAKH